MNVYELLTVIFAGASAIAAIIATIKAFVNGRELMKIDGKLQQVQQVQTNIQMGFTEMQVKKKSGKTDAHPRCGYHQQPVC